MRTLDFMFGLSVCLCLQSLRIEPSLLAARDVLLKRNETSLGARNVERGLYSQASPKTLGSPENLDGGGGGH